MAAWDEDDHLLDDILDDDANGEVGDGWDEDLTGLSSDEEPAPAPTAEAEALPGDSLNVESRPPSGAATLAVTSDQAEKMDDNAWDFDEFEESSDDAAPPATANVVHSNDDMPLNTEEENSPSVVSEEATKQIDGRQDNEWDFEDDLFVEDDKSSSAQMVEQVAFKPPIPPPPPVQSNPFTSNTVQQPSNPFLQQSMAQTQINPIIDITEKQPEPTIENQATADDFGDNGWSDDEAFFDEGMDDLAPVAPNTTKSPPPPPPPTQPQTLQPLTGPQLKIFNLLQRYLTNISSPHFLPHLHSKMHSSDMHTQSRNLREYYATRPGLKQYTLGVEMDRMDYTLVTHDGRRVLDKKEIRDYFTSSPGIVVEEEQPTVDEVLIRSANQSLLADALILLTGSEDALLNDEFINNEEMCLILSGPLLCMTSIAETCKFVVDLMNGVVEATIFLAIGIPYHGQAVEDESIVKDGRLVLARARVLVRFRPGCAEMSEESTVQYLVESVEPSFSSAEVSCIRDASISLAMDHNDPFFQHDEVQDAGTEDVRDLFLLNHHLLSDSHLIAVSNHLVRLKGAAEASSTGFRSALQQLDGVTGVSGKLNMIKKATGGASHGAGIGGFLSLPSAQEIEAAELEAANSISFVDEARFPRPNDLPNQHATHAPLHGQSRPPPPPPPLPPQMMPHEDAGRPRPLIGGMFLSGLSRLAAAATQPNEAPHLHHGQSESQMYGSDDYAKSSYHVPQWDGTSGGTGLTPAHDSTSSVSPPQQMISHPETLHTNINESRQEEKFEDANETDGGWSDDGLDFEDDDQLQEVGKQPMQVIQNHNLSVPAASAESSDMAHSRPKLPEHETAKEELKFEDAKQVPSYPPATAKCRPEPIPTFEEEFVVVLKEKVEQEEAEMRDSGKMTRWRPLSEDHIRRQRLMEVMMVQLDRS
eukprot:scaffold38562_cov64-Cyclotella_meneghiniana.AAC.3